MEIDKDEAKQLADYFSHQYIDHTDYPLVINLLKRLLKFIENGTNKS